MTAVPVRPAGGGRVHLALEGSGSTLCGRRMRLVRSDAAPTCDRCRLYLPRDGSGASAPEPSGDAAKLERMRAAAAAPAEPLRLEAVGSTGRAWRLWRGAGLVAQVRTGSGRRYLVVRLRGGYVVKRSDSLDTARAFARRGDVSPAAIIDSARGELVG